MTMFDRLIASITAVVLLLGGNAYAQAPITIGFLSPLSGAIAAGGKDMYSGCELYWQETGWQVANLDAGHTRPA
jgi:ABC-type branched-subunit amino acid transport system substrate-binding protein